MKKIWREIFRDLVKPTLTVPIISGIQEMAVEKEIVNIFK